MIKWLTTEQVIAARMKGPEEALECSIEHHAQICRATKKEFMAGRFAGKVNLSVEFCALCRLYNTGEVDVLCNYNRKRCPLRGSTSYCCSAWRRSNRAFLSVLMRKGSWRDFKIAERKLLNKLKACRKR